MATKLSRSGAVVHSSKMQALRAHQGPVCSTSGREGSSKQLQNGLFVSTSRQQVTARAHGSSNANTVPVLPQASARTSSKAFGSRLSRKSSCVVRSVLADAPSQALEGFTRGGHWQVHKFGGTCMASAARLKAAAQLVSSTCWGAVLGWQHWSNCCYSCCCCC